MMSILKHKNYHATIEYFKEMLQGEDVEERTNNSHAQQMKQKLNQMLMRALLRIEVSDVRSALYSYLHVKPIRQLSVTDVTPIFPFGCNASQKQATEQALAFSVSAIQGPPGTGKTQTILNILANLVMLDKRVAIVSNSNSAVTSIKEKMERSGYGSLLALLGNATNLAQFFEQLEPTPLDPSWKLSGEEKREALFALKSLEKSVTEGFEQQQNLSLFEGQLRECRLEYAHFLAEQPLTVQTKERLNGLFHAKWTSKMALHLKAMVGEIEQLSGLKRWKRVFVLLIEFWCYRPQRLQKEVELLEMYANDRFYSCKIAELTEAVEKSQKWLQQNHVEKIAEEYRTLSVRLFRNKIFQLKKQQGAFRYTLQNFRTRFFDFLKSYPIVLSSTHSLFSSTQEGFKYDYLIIEEASQVDVIKASICLSLARNVIVIGDSKQLTHIVDKEAQQRSTLAQERYRTPEAYDYVGYNILDSYKCLYGEALPTVLLREHYRCHPLIIEFCNKKFYDGSLIVMTPDRGVEHPFRIIETNRGERTSGAYNQRQIDETLTYLTEHYVDWSEVGVISPYRMHANKFNESAPEGLEVDTIHRFQGREKRTIVMNTISDQLNTFIDDPNLINVAVSRAMDEFILVKSPHMELAHGTNLGDLVRYIHYTTDAAVTTVEGSVCSVFDILYKEFHAEYAEAQQVLESITGSPAEKIIWHLLKEDILPSSERYATIEVVREYHLLDLVKGRSDFQPEELTYIYNRSRLDFLLYSKMDKSPLLAIEVDGVSFHSDEVQRRRDALKDAILQKMGLPLLRLSTNGSNERALIVAKLEEIVGQG